MSIFSRLVSLLAALPDWVPLIVLPALLPCGALLLALLKKRRFYACIALALGAFGVAVTACKGGEALVYAGLFTAVAVLFALLLLVPFKRRKKGPRESRDDRIYRKFHEDLEGAPLPQGLPPKVCCFETAPPAPVQESEVRLGHVRSLIERLKKEKLSAADRLEVEAVSRSVDSCMGRPLGRAEIEFLNDCLASVLKLTAKYKL